MKGEPSPPRPTPRSRATGQEGGGPADGWPRPLVPKQRQTRHRGDGERQHQQYCDWLRWLPIGFE
ncbi:hypothetical protein EYF80_033648 [Liparis tanakae]|uniref:Uncharacterized protein n=1 Tax=Liparis tanakae TaxID=230148 RepID=A0A4Z2GQZ5_9TELE|nr:hypothetical protein EYF80_033648 [Liparis tanakae]